MARSFRVKCACGNVMNATPGSVCSKCRQPVMFPQGGIFSLYRMGSPLGVAGGFGIYINGEPMGHIGNKETVHIPLPYGTFNIHVAVGMSRKCQDLIVNITPENNMAYAKVYIKPGFWANSFVIQSCTAADMPND